MTEPFSVLAFGSLSSIATGLETANRNREFVVSVASTIDVAQYYVEMHAIDCILCALPLGRHGQDTVETDAADPVEAAGQEALSSLRERSPAPIVVLTDPDDDVADIDDELYDAIHRFGAEEPDEDTESLPDTIRRAVRGTRDRRGAHGDNDDDPRHVSESPAASGTAATGEATTGEATTGEATASDTAAADDAAPDDGNVGERGQGGDDFDATAALTTGPEMSAELQRSNAELEQFAYVAAHDLREPLRMVSSYLQLLQRRYGDELDDDADEFIGYAVDGADRMRQMINDLLAYARVDRYEEEFAELDAGDAVETALSNLAVAIEESDASVTVGELPPVVGDRRQLTRLFQNLVSNAIKYAGDDPPAIRIDCTRRTESDGYYEFTVADDGIGIEPERQEEVFAIFQSGSDDSTGIGLAICEKVVARHGGNIWVESTPGDGTTFHFTLPVPDERTPADAREASQSESVEAN